MQDTSQPLLPRVLQAVSAVQLWGMGYMGNEKFPEASVTVVKAKARENLEKFFKLKEVPSQV